ncbi:MAG: hypothetical protein ACHWZW_04715 [Spirulina sp.]
MSTPPSVSLKAHAPVAVRQVSLFDELSDSGFHPLHVPLDVLVSIPASIRQDEIRLNDYLIHGLKLGLGALAQAAVSLDTTEYVATIQREFAAIQQSWSQLQTESRQELEQLIDQELTGENSALATELKRYLADGGTFTKALEDIHRKLADPNNLTSIPGQVKALLSAAFEQADAPFRKALSIADHNSPLGQLLEHQQRELANHKAAITQLHTNLHQEFKEQFELIKNGLNIQALLEQQQAEQSALLEKSIQKGRPFEVVAAECLDQASRYCKDIVTPLSDELVEGTGRKVGDVLVEIFDEACADIKIVVETKAGQYNIGGKRGLIKQMQEAMEFRNAQAAIAVVHRDYAKQNQAVYSELGHNLVMVAVDPDNEESGLLPLELAYLSTRSKLIALHRKGSSEQLDLNAIQQTIDQLSACLNSAQAMKANCTAAKTSVDKVYADIQQMESGVKQQLSTLRSQLGLA